jgi:heterodisulfide reductase subunit C
MTSVAMLVLLAVALGAFAYSMKYRLAILGAGKPENRLDRVGDRLKVLFEVAIAQKKMFKEPVYGTMHAFIFWGFMVLSVRSIALVIMAFVPEFHIPGIVGGVYTLSKDIFELLVLLMVTYGAYRRLFDPPERITASMEGVFILSMIGTLMITDFLFDGARIAAGRAPAEEAAWAVVGAQFAKFFQGGDPQMLATVEGVSYWVHVAVLFTFLNFLPYGKHFHVITSLPNVFFTKLEPRGKLSDMNLEDENAESFGTAKAEDFTWKQMLDSYTCTECGRCTVNCPAWLTDKPLNPKFLINDIKHHLYSEADRLTKKKTAEELPPTTPDGESKLILSVNEDVLWSCTTCRSCEENCPVMISHVDKIVDMRRYLVLTEAKFPKELNQAFKNLEQKGNPWGEPSAARDKWMADPELADIEITHISEKPDAEWLFWVGCAGAYDDRQRKVTNALVKIMAKAGLNFAVLGAEETCTGDPARRAGNEYLFQMLAQQNVETLNGYNVKKIVTHCPHCLNTLLNEYPSFGGK